MTFNELTRLLTENGWQLKRQGKGSAQIWVHPDRQGAAGLLSIHVHPSKEVPKGTLAAILKHAGIERS